MGPFISAPSAQAHLLLLRQPTRTQQVCKSPTLGSVFFTRMLEDSMCNFASGSLWSSQGRPVIGPSGWHVPWITTFHLDLGIRNRGLGSFLGRWKGIGRVGEKAQPAWRLPQCEDLWQYLNLKSQVWKHRGLVIPVLRRWMEIHGSLGLVA